MNKYTIKPRMLEAAMQQAVAMHVHAAMERFRGEFGEHEGLVARIATVAAENAVEQFSAYCNAELRLIEADHERRMDEFMTRPLAQFLQAAVNPPEAEKSRD